MTAQPDHPANRSGTGFSPPPIQTLADLRTALSTWGFPGDRAAFEEQLDSIELDDLAQVRALTQAYRHRLLLRYDPQGMAALARPTDDVEAELRRKLAEADR